MDAPSPVALVEKNGTSAMLVMSSSQTATTTFINEGHKDTKTNTAMEQESTANLMGDMPTLGNGHTGSSGVTNGLLTNGHTDPSELRLLQHEHH
jgi:hypothetical protein